MTPEQRAREIASTAWFVDKDDYERGVRKIASAIREAYEDAAWIAEKHNGSQVWPMTGAKIAKAIRSRLKETQ